MYKTIIQAALATIMSLAVSLSANAGLIINEIFQNPSAVNDSDGEWFELFNNSLVDINIDGWTIKDDGSDSFVISNGGSLIVSAGGFLVLGSNSVLSENGGIAVDYEYAYGGPGMFLANGADELVLLDDLLIEVDRVNWTGAAPFPDPIGASMALTSTLLDNNLGSSWSTSTTALSGGDSATPGACNSDVGQNCTVEVPEPTSIAILGFGLLGLVFSRKKIS